jgi:tripartite-type tricarboxylate transporter receptor subunit TctC
MLRRAITAGFLAGITLVAATLPGWTQNYPSRPIRIIVPFAAGGAVDTFARLIGSRMSDAVGQAVIVENRPGAAGNIGADAVAKSAPDGYTILQTTNGHALNPAIRLKLTYDPVKDFVPVTQLTHSSTVVVASAKHDIHSLRDLIAQAKAKPAGIDYGSTGVGSPLHLAMEMLKSAAGIDIVHVSYRGDAPLNTALLAGEIQVAIVPLATALPHFQSGALRPLAVTTAERSAVLPNVPTVAENGFPGFDVSSWQAWFMPAGTPRAIVDRVQEEASKAMKNADVAERLKVFGSEAVGSSPDAFAKRFTEDVANFKKVVSEAKIPAQE